MHKDHLMQLKKEEVWNNVVTKIAFRDCRKEALDIPQPTKEQFIEARKDDMKKELDVDVRDPLLYGIIPSPQVNLGKKKPVEFKLNNEILECNTLDVFPLPEDYKVEFNGLTLADHKVVQRTQKMGTDWMARYSFDNVPVTNLDEQDLGLKCSAWKVLAFE